MSRHNNTPRENSGTEAPAGTRMEKIRKYTETTAVLGMAIICISLLIPLFNLTDVSSLSIYKWIYAAGAFIYLISRTIGSGEPGEPLRLRRMRRMEFWAGIAFAIGAGLWFYKEAHSPSPFAGPLYFIKDTILFTLVGAAIQIVASWLIYFATKKNKK